MIIESLKLDHIFLGGVHQLGSGGKPSTLFPPGWLVELLATQTDTHKHKHKLKHKHKHTYTQTQTQYSWFIKLINIVNLSAMFYYIDYHKSISVNTILSENTLLKILKISKSSYNDL